jgi:hypothetical protein
MKALDANKYNKLNRYIIISRSKISIGTNVKGKGKKKTGNGLKNRNEHCSTANQKRIDTVS